MAVCYCRFHWFLAVGSNYTPNAEAYLQKDVLETHSTLSFVESRFVIDR